MRPVLIYLLASTLVALNALAAPAAAADPEGLAALGAKSAKTDQGLALVLGDADGKLTLALALAKATRMRVQALTPDRESAEKCRRVIETSGVAERTSAVWQRTAHLPHLDNLINLVVVDGWGTNGAKPVSLAEVVRVLCPGGAAVVGSDSGADAAALLAEAGKVKLAKAEKLERAGAWIRIVKQMDPDFGEWPSLAGGPEMNMTSTDRAVGAGKELRWVSGPVWSTGSYRNEIVAGGRAFHEEAEWVSPGVRTNGYGLRQWSLVARDAFNGFELWREKFADSGASAPQWRMCADDKNVYHLEGKNLVARDAATGKLARDYGPGPSFVTVLGDCLVFSAGNVAVVEKETGKVRWKRPAAWCHPAGKDGAVYVLSGDGVEAVGLADGKSLWKTPVQGLVGRENLTLMCKADAVYVIQLFREKPGAPTLTQTLTALDRAGGAVRWTDKRDQTDIVLPLAEQVVLASKVKSDKPGVNVLENVVLDAKTGKQGKVTRTPSSQHIGTRCWGPRATDRFLIYEGRFYVDTATFALSMREGIRSSCGFGQFVAYGLEYNGPHACNCEVSLRGVAALSGGSAIPKGEVAPQLFRGPGSAASGAPAGAADWPTYRGDLARSDAYGAELPAELKPLWAARLGARPLPQATGLGNLVFAAQAEAGRVVALDLETGKPRWTFPAEGRVTVAPTYHKGVCLFGDQAGWVYCLAAADGKLVWQFQAAPEQRYMGAWSALESSWPVKSGVLVLGETAYFAAGRCGTMDGGIWVYGLDVAGGGLRWKRNFTDIRPTDILRSDGSSLFFGVTALDPASGADRTGAAGKPGRRILMSSPDRGADISIMDELSTLDPLSLRERKKLLNNGAAFGELVAFDSGRSIVSWRRGGYTGGMDGKITSEEEGRCHLLSKGKPEWINKEAGQQMQALLLAGARIYAAGIPEARDSRGKPALLVLSSADGKELQKIVLDAAPSIDGLSAVGGRLIMTTVDGQVLCFGAN